MDDPRERIEAAAIGNGTIAQVQCIAGGEFRHPDGRSIAGLPDFCRVAVCLQPAAGSHIHVEVWLPIRDWNGRFFGTGNGGGAGSIAYESLAYGIRQGYATANTDMGTSPNVDEAIDFPERWEDFGHRATHLMTTAAKSIVQAYYGRPPAYAYFWGDSTGGQQALQEAQRYPLDYDGIIAGVPANNRTLLHTAFLWNHKALNEEPGSALLPEELDRVTQCMLAHRSAEDGGFSGDRFFTDTRSLDADLNDVLAEAHLNPAQMAALRKIYSGPVNPRTGEQIYTPIPAGSESMPLGLQYEQDPQRCPNDLFYVFRWAFGKAFDWREFDFDRDLDAFQQKMAPILNANSPDLSAFKGNGGKLLMYSGTADPLVPYQDALHYYERVIGQQQGIEAAQSFFRFFLIPGRCHGEDGSPGFRRVGNGEDDSILTALAAWVERGTAPDRPVVTAYRDGSPANGIAAQRYVYPYPQFAHYVGGDENSPDAYRAVEHPRGNVAKPADRYLD